MNRSILSLLLVGVLILSISVPGQTVQAQGLSFPAEMNKRFSPDSIVQGGTTRLTVTIFNPNVFPLTNASWTDNPISNQPGLFIANPPNSTTNCGSGTVTAVAGGTSLSLSGGTVPAQQGTTPGACTVSVDVTAMTSGNLVDTIPAGTLSAEGGGGSVTNASLASATLRVAAVRPPSVSKSFAPNTILLGETSRLTIRIRNNDLNTALTQTSLTDQLPPNVVLANPVSPTLTNCGASASLTADPGSSSVVLENSTIAANTTCTIRVNVIATDSGIYVNTIPADAVENDQRVSNASPASATLNVQEVGISKAFSPASFQAGGTTTLTITLENPSSIPYTGATLFDELPGTVLTVVSDTAATTCGGGTASTALPRTVSLSGGTIPAGTPTNPGTCTITVQVTAPANATAETFTNTIPAGRLETDQGVSNIVPATAQVRVYQLGTGMSGSKTFSRDTILAGENSRLTISITAPADTNLTNFRIADQLPLNVVLANPVSPTLTNCGAASLTADPGSSSIVLTIPIFAANTTCTIQVNVTSSTGGVHTNTIGPGDITNNENRTVPNPLTDDLTVQVLTDFSMSKVFTPPTVNPGGISTLTITLQNTNTSPLINASVTDNLPGTPTNGVIVAPTPNASTTCAGGDVVAAAGSQTISMTGGTVPEQAGNIPGTCTISVDVQGLGSLTTHTNTIPIANASATIQGTSTVISPGQPASANLVIGNLVIGVVKNFIPDEVFGGSASTLSIGLTNPNAVPLTGITFTDNMPTGMIIANPANLFVGNCGGTLSGTPGDGSFSLSGASLQPGSSCTVTLSVTMTVNGNLENIIPAHSVTTLSGASNPDPAQKTLTNLPGASVSKFFTPNPVPAGDHALLTIRIQNTGSAALSGMGLIDLLPAGLEVLNSPAPVNDCGGTLTAAGGTQIIRLVGGALAASSSCDIVVSVTAGTTGSYVNTIDAGSLTNDQNATNHEVATDTLVVTNSVIGGGGTGGGGGGSGGTGTGDSTPVSGTRAFIIPLTGFAPDVVTPLEPAAGPQYDATTLSLEIPFLKIDTSVVGVPMKDGAWDVSWLYDQVGWLNGTAYPTWDGNSLLTAHVVKADGQPGPFYNLKYLSVGEYIFIYHGGYRYTYQVLSNTLVHPGDASVLRHEEKSYLTLVTCDEYDEKTGTYLRRVAVRAKLVDVREVQ